MHRSNCSVRVSIQGISNTHLSGNARQQEVGYFPYLRLIEGCGDRRLPTFRQKEPWMAGSTPLRARPSGIGSAANAAGTCEDGLRPASVNDESGASPEYGVSWAGSWQPGVILTTTIWTWMRFAGASSHGSRRAAPTFGWPRAPSGGTRPVCTRFIHRGTPRVLAENDRETLVEHLGCSPEELRHDRFPSADLQPRPPLAVPGGYCAVREIDARAAAGPGAWNEEAERTKAIWILGERLVLHEFQARPEKLRMITLGGLDGATRLPWRSDTDRDQ